MIERAREEGGLETASDNFLVLLLSRAISRIFFIIFYLRPCKFSNSKKKQNKK